MKACQISIKRNHSTKAINQLLRLPAIIAGKYSGRPLHHIIERNATFVARAVIRLIGEKLCHLMSNHLGGVVLAIRKLIEDGKQKTPNGWHSLKLEDTLGKRERLVSILLKNGKPLKNSITTDVLYAENERFLLKTISYHYQKVVQTISQTFNLFAVTAIVKSGNTRLCYFNIYENPELLEVTNE